MALAKTYLEHVGTTLELHWSTKRQAVEPHTERFRRNLADEHQHHPFLKRMESVAAKVRLTLD